MAQEFLHNLPRIDHSFNSVSNEIIMPDTPTDIFAWNTDPYLQSIQMYAYIPIAIGILYVIICLLITLSYCCFGRCKNMFSYGKVSNPKENANYHKLSLLYDKNQEHFNENRRLTRCSRVIRWTFALVVLAALIFAIVYGTSFNKSIIDIADDWTNSYNDYETIVGDATEINTIHIPNSQLQCALILNISTAEPIYPNITELNNTLSIAQTLVSAFLVSSSNVPRWDIVNDTITPYREFAIIFPVIALVVFGLLNILNYLCFSHDYLNKKTFFCSCSLLIIYLGFFIFIIGCIQFAVSVLIADGCKDPNQSIWQAVDAYNSDETTKDIIKYYLYCIENDTIINPLYTEFNASYYELISLNHSIYTLHYTNISEILGITDQTNALYSDYSQSLELMNEINDTIHCQNIDSYKVNMTNELCGNALDYWLVYYVLQIAFIVLLVVRSWCICTENKSKKNENEIVSIIEPRNYGTAAVSMDEGESQLELHERADSMFTYQSKTDVHDENNNVAVANTIFNDKVAVDSDSEHSLDEINSDIINISINIKCNDEVTQYNINNNQTIYDLMEMIENTMKIDTAEQKLTHMDGNQLLPDAIVGNTLKNGQTINLLVLEVTLSNEYDKYEVEQHNDDLDLPQ